MSDEATSGSNPASGPVPNTVCTNVQFFSGALDMLAYHQATKFKNGTCLLLEPGAGTLFAVGLCGKKHVHLHVGPFVTLGEMVPVVVSAYAFALVYDRESWAAGLVPDATRAKQALRDCLDTLKLHAPALWVDELARPSAKLLNTWVKGAIAGGSLRQREEPCEADA